MHKNGIFNLVWSDLNEDYVRFTFETETKSRDNYWTGFAFSTDQIMVSKSKIYFFN
jgi:hypothetical protein